jgi:hypothetical protein
MIKLFKFDRKKDDWVFFDYGILTKVDEYLRRGLIVWFH